MKRMLNRLKNKSLSLLDTTKEKSLSLLNTAKEKSLKLACKYNIDHNYEIKAKLRGRCGYKLKCSRCDEEDIQEHDFGDYQVNPQNACELIRICKLCNEKANITRPNHKYVTWVSHEGDPCKLISHCERCQHPSEIKDNHKPRKERSFDPITGQHYYECTTCEKRLKEEFRIPNFLRFLGRRSKRKKQLEKYEIDVLLSHSSSDKKYIRAIRDDLESQRIICWLDEGNIGHDIFDEINEALKKCNIILLCFSKNAMESTYFKKEVGAAVHLTSDGESSQRLAILCVDNLSIKKIRRDFPLLANIRIFRIRKNAKEYDAFLKHILELTRKR